ncbi:hypothetical protein ZWY2020_030091 [Hordeum vulgare]|nr:hypothetical protein ZWY2020_030091 [Hordeum vulgare]
MARQHALHGARGDAHALCRIEQGQRERLCRYLVSMPVFELRLSAPDRVEQITTLLGAGALLVAEAAGEKRDHPAHHVADDRREDGLRHGHHF